MDVILRQDVEDLGKRGQLVKVNADYARDFLIPKKLADASRNVSRSIAAQEREQDKPESVENVPQSHAAPERELLIEAVRVFGDRELAQEWIEQPIPSLGDRKPIDLIRSSAAERERVYTILGRIEYGVF